MKWKDLPLLVLVSLSLTCGPAGSGSADSPPAPADSPPIPLVDAFRPDAPPPPPPPIPPECREAADRGVAWLVAQQQPGGAWPGSSYTIATTAFAVLKLETHALELGKSPFDPTYQYQANVVSGLSYLFSQGTIAPITSQVHGNPDTNGNGTGIYFSSLMYENAIALMAVVAGSDPLQVVATTGPLNGMTFAQVAQDQTDYLSWAQSDGQGTTPFLCERGGWRYSPINNSTDGDNSVSQFVTLALDYAEHPNYNFECTVPDWVKVELNEWVSCIQVRDGGPNDGGSGYMVADQSTNAYKTGAVVQQLAYLGQPESAPAVQAGLGYLVRHWNDTSGIGWKGTPALYLSMYSIMKAMEALAIEDVGGIDWYSEFCDVLVLQQNVDGSWPVSWVDVGGNNILSTEWALLVLERAAPPPIVIE